MNDRDYLNKIQNIPHLNLTPYLPIFPLEAARLELLQNMHCISKFDYSRNVDSARIKFLQETWQGFSLVDITKLGAHMIDYYTSNLTHQRIEQLGVEIGEDHYAKFFITDIGQRMPVTTAYTTGMFQDLCRIRISQLKANSEIKYHCHQRKAKQNPNKIVRDESYRATIHIPLITNPYCYFVVTEDTGFDGHPDDFKLTKNQPEFKQKYDLGEIWMFNSVHYHKAINNGNQNRLHILIYFDFMDTKIRPIIEKAMDDYTEGMIG
jgi:hypothetical protein